MNFRFHFQGKGVHYDSLAVARLEIFFLKTQCSACAFSLILVSFFPQAIEISDKIIVKTLAIWKAYSKTVQFTI